MKTASWILWLGIPVGLFFLGRCSKRCEKEEVVTIKRDTLIRVDTIRIEVPKENFREIVHTEIVTAPADTVYLPGDTVRIEVPIEVVEYRDSLYALEIEGYRPRLNWIDVYPRTEYINTLQTQTIYKKSRRWSLGPAVAYGYDIQNNHWAPFVGVSINYALLSW